MMDIRKDEREEDATTALHCKSRNDRMDETQNATNFERPATSRITPAGLSYITAMPRPWFMDNMEVEKTPAHGLTQPIKTEADQDIATARAIRKQIRSAKRAEMQKSQRDAKPTRPIITGMPKPTLLLENSTPTRQLNCTWCVMSKVHGVTKGFIASHILCSCKVALPAEKVIRESDHDGESHQAMEGAYEGTYADSVQHTNYDSRDDNTPNVSLENKMLQECVAMKDWVPNTSARRPQVDAERHYFREDVCIAMATPHVNHSAAEHTLIFAPPKMGKTEFQNVMHNRCIMILDTEDLPEANADDVEHLLERSSVVTNRLDLFGKVKARKVAFLPSKWEYLSRRLPKVRPEVTEKWWSMAYHQAMHDRGTTLVLTDKKYIADWFKQVKPTRSAHALPTLGEPPDVATSTTDQN